VLLTNPGVPFVYYGEEIGMQGGKPDERIRTPMPWNDEAPGFGFTSGQPWEPLEAGWETANVAAQVGDPGSLLAHYRSLIAVRNAHPALRSGTFMPMASSDPTVYAFLVTRPDDTVAVIVNLGSEDVAGYELAADAGAACGIATAVLAYADGLAAGSATVTAPSANAVGAFSGWRPLPVLPAHGTVVVDLGP
jgi:glycosidase